jgi:hypothetical protein
VSKQWIWPLFTWGLKFQVISLLSTMIINIFNRKFQYKDRVQEVHKAWAHSFVPKLEHGNEGGKYFYHQNLQGFLIL